MPLKLKSVYPSILELLVLVPGAAQFSSVHLGPRDCFFYYLQFHHATHNDPKPRPNWIWVKVITSLCRVDHIHVSLATSYRSFLMISRQTSVFWVWSGTPSHPTMYSSTAHCSKASRKVPHMFRLFPVVSYKHNITKGSLLQPYLVGAAIYMLTQSHIPHHHVGRHCVPQRILEQWFQNLVGPLMTQLYCLFQVYSIPL